MCVKVALFVCQCVDQVPSTSLPYSPSYLSSHAGGEQSLLSADIAAEYNVVNHSAVTNGCVILTLVWFKSPGQAMT